MWLRYECNREINFIIQKIFENINFENEKVFSMKMKLKNERISIQFLNEKKEALSRELLI